MAGFLLVSFRREFSKGLARLPIMFERSLQMLVVRVLFELRQKRLESCLSVTYKTVVHFRAAAQLFSPEIDLDDRRVLWKKLLVREIRPDHEQEIAIHHCVIARRKAEQTGHSHIKRVVVLDKLFSAHGVHDWSVQFSRERDQFLVRSGTARAAKDRDLLRFI